MSSIYFFESFPMICMVFHISEFENPILRTSKHKNEMPAFFSTFTGFVSLMDSTNEK